jgi:lauroyl/myristoyl acyltransferase
LPGRWKSFRYLLEERGLDMLASWIPRLSRARAVKLGLLLGDLAYVFDGRGREVANGNLECVFGDRLTPEGRRWLVRASYRNFVRTMVDLFWAPSLTHENYREWMKLEGFEELHQRHAKSPGGSIFLCIHQGNWEWASLACGFEGFGNVVVAEPFKNELLSAVFNRLREVSGQKIIPQEASMLRLLKTVKRGGATGMLLDLNLQPSQAATIIEGFKPDGLKMCVTYLHALLAQRAGTLLIPVETEPHPDGTCRIIAHPPVEWPEGASVQEIAQRCWDAMEPIIHARPAGWLWAYKHFRYRPKGSGRAYPRYANVSGKFEKLWRGQVDEKEIRDQRAEGREAARVPDGDRASLGTER